MQILNDLRPWWGLYPPAGHQMSAADLIRNGTLDLDAAALVWTALERGASAWVVAGPQGAGKTTLATALLPWLPDDARLYVTYGPRDQLDLPEQRDHTYLLINELSWHLPFYLSGPAATRAFELLTQGVRVVGTLHALSASQAVEVMCETPGVSRSTLARVSAPMLVLVLSARRTAAGIARRVIEVALLQPHGDEVRVRDASAQAFAECFDVDVDAIAAQVALKLAALSAQS